jgi:2-polyprenyl-6-methoxyphenol hydroxylase-like FAD-dependent oxidoreductase
MHWDLIVVGGGIGGAALATVMARKGKSVLMLEQSTVFQDRVRGEWIAPWGVVETKRLGLYDCLVEAGGHHLTRHVSYDELLPPEMAEAHVLPLGMFAEGVPGPLCIGHPHHCQTLFDEAKRAGVQTVRPAQVTSVTLGARPSVTYLADGAEHVAEGDLIAGAEGRVSVVRAASGMTLHQDTPHHWFGGLLVSGVAGWDDDLQAIGTEASLGFLVFPQGKGRVRVYGGYALAEKSRFAGPEGARRFLDAFSMRSCPKNQHVVDGTPAGPLFSYINSDSWTDAPYSDGMVLVGDAAGWNDPIIGQGLSITYRDVRIVTDILAATPAGAKPDFRPYAEERAERMRRLRFAAHLTSVLDMEFGEAAAARRLSYHQRRTTDPTLGMHGLAAMAGPENTPAEIFTEAHRARVLQG